jgi:uncharacterized membrane protein YgaE (UPF0421/DUF939 family)
MDTKITVGLMGLLVAGLVYQYFFPTPDVITKTKLKEVTTKYEESQKKVQEYATKLTESDNQIKTLTNWSKLDQTQYELKERIQYYENGNKKAEARTITKKTSSVTDYSNYVSKEEHQKTISQVTTLTEENTQLKVKIDKLTSSMTSSVVRNRTLGIGVMSDSELAIHAGYTVFKDISIELLGAANVPGGIRTGVGVAIRF